MEFIESKSKNSNNLVPSHFSYANKPYLGLNYSLHLFPKIKKTVFFVKDLHVNKYVYVIYMYIKLNGSEYY